MGAKLSRHSSGYFKIDKILKGENYRENLRSPLSEVGLNVKEGDYITAINGVSVKQYQDVYEALKGKANTLVRLSISEKSIGRRCPRYHCEKPSMMKANCTITTGCKKHS